MIALYVILLWCASFKISISQPQVTCLTGTYVGVERSTYAGIKYDAFMGIQFAQVVERFKEAIPVKNDSSIKFGATKFGPDCYQDESKDHPAEDCLYLNIYSPNIKGKLPVLFFIYGGGFNMGSTYYYDPEYFMDTKRVVIVTVAYRLGPFGFLYFDDPKYPANLGLRDQILGLKWARQNIANFGGDPNKITLNGQSAGAASVNILMHSPLAKGLFVGGISESGTSCSPWALQPRCTGLHKLKLLASKTGCGAYLPNNDRNWSAEPIANCLNMLTPRQITEAVQYFPKWELIVPFPPIVEEESVPQPVITIFPWMNSSYSDNLVPWISGTNSDEATDLVREYYPNNVLESLAIKIFNGFVLSELLYYRYTSLFPLLVTAEIKLHFFKDNIFNFQRFISEVISLGFFYYPNYQCLTTNESPSYAYFFNYRQQSPRNEQIQERLDGVGHGGELPYLWKQSNNVRLQGSKSDYEISQNLVNAWIDFAYYQSPNYSNISWERYLKNKKRILVIDEHSAKMIEDPNMGNNKFWRSLETNLYPMTSNCDDKIYFFNQNVKKKFK